MAIKVNLDRLLEDRGVTIRELSDAIGITPANLSVLKNNHARASAGILAASQVSCLTWWKMRSPEVLLSGQAQPAFLNTRITHSGCLGIPRELKKTDIPW